jgi:hypothetical protein
MKHKEENPLAAGLDPAYHQPEQAMMVMPNQEEGIPTRALGHILSDVRFIVYFDKSPGINEGK